MAKKKYRVSAQLFTLREHLKTPKDMVKTMRRLRKIGYAAAQISGVGPIEPADLNKLMTDEGIQPIGAHVGLDAFKDVPAVAAQCQDWGIKYVAIPWMPADAVKTAAGWKKMGRDFTKIGKALAKEGITLQYHNHCFEFAKFGIKGGKGGKVGLDILYDNSDPKYLQAELDFGWVARGGHNPVTWAKKMKGRLDQVHLKDWGIKDNEPVWRAIGEGGIEWADVIKAAKKSGTKDFIIEQDSCTITKNPFKSLAISFENVKKLGL